jgi:N-acetylmuramoyl-L-alanine amidase
MAKIYTSNGGELNPATITASKFVVLLDNGHAKSTPGKKSPLLDNGKRFYEYEFARDIVKRISKELDKLHISYKIVTPVVDPDIPLSTRANRVNRYCQKFGKNNCLLISIHANAAGMGDKWMNARGWSVYTTKGKTKSDEYADIFYKEAEKILPLYGMTLRKDTTDGDFDYEQDFTLLYKS